MANMQQPTAWVQPITIRKHDVVPPGFRSGLVRVEHLENLRPGNLSSPILEVFKGLHTATSGQAVRLASHLVRAALPSFHSILCRRPTETGQTDERGDEVYQYPEPYNTLTESQEQEVMEKLNAMADIVHFEKGAAVQVSYGITHPQAEARCPKLPGMGSTIHIMAHLWDEIFAAHFFGEDLIRRQFYNLLFATTLLHELAHAAQCVAGERYAFENIYLGEAALTTELGFEVEKRLFGCIFGYFMTRFTLFTHNEVPSSCTSVMQMQEWPQPWIVDRYNEDAHKQAIYTRPGCPIPALPEWSVSMLFVHRLHSEELWQTRRATGNYSDLQPPRHTGFHDKTSAMHQNFVRPRGYREHRKGLIYRKADADSVLPLIPKEPLWSEVKRTSRAAWGVITGKTLLP